MIFERETEITRIEAALADVAAGHGRVVLLLGEPGIGKTRLADEVARIARQRGLAVSWARCAEAGPTRAYAPWAEALRTIVAETTEALSDLGPILPDLRSHAPSEDATEARRVLFEATLRHLRAAAERRPRVLIFDDLHVADEATLRLLRFVAREIRGAPILVLGTQRDVAKVSSPDRDALLRELARDAERLSLRRLSLEVVTAWVVREEPRARAMAAALHRVSEGNPLFVEEALRVSLARGELTKPIIPGEVQAVIAAHVDLCDDDARELLAIGSVMGREISIATLARATGRSEDDVRGTLARAAAVGLASEREDGALVIGHVLVHAELDRRLGRQERAAAHWRIGRALAAAGELVRGAHHMSLGLDAGEVEILLASVRTAADDALARDAWEDAIAVLDAASRALPVGDPRAIALSLDAAAARIRAGALESGRREVLRLVGEEATRRDPELLARAALAYGQELRGAHAAPVLARLAREALAALPAEASRWRARVMARLAAALVPGRPEDHAEAHALAMEAIGLAARPGHDATELAVLQWAVPAMVFTMRASERAVLVRRWIDLATRERDASAELRARQFDLLHRIEDGDTTSGLIGIESVLQRLARPYFAWRLPLAQAVAALARGEVVEARRRAGEMRELAAAGGAPFARMLHATLQLSLAYADADASEWRRVEAESADLLRHAPPAEYFRALGAALGGRLDEARGHLRERVPTRELPASVLVVAGAVAWLVDDRALASEVYALLADDEDRNPFSWGPSGAIAFGPNALVLARLATTLERPMEARHWYERTLARTVRVFPVHRARAERELASLGAPHDGPPRPSAPRDLPRITREGEGFRVEGFGASARVDDRRGMHYLARLLAEPGREMHVLDLIDAAVDEHDTGPLLDARTKAAYRARLAQLSADLEEATRNADLGRAERARAEIDALTEQLASAVGLGGRDRPRGAAVERARINVQRRLRDVLSRIERQAPDLGKRLRAAIRTGAYCAYDPAF